MSIQAGDFCAFIKWLYLLERDSPYSERKRRLTKAYRCFGTKSPLPLMSLISGWKYHKRVLKLYPERVIQWEAMKKVIGE